MNAADQVSRDTPLRLKQALDLAFPYGGPSVAWLRKEAAAGRLEISRLAGKDFTTLAAIDRLKTLCRVQPKAPAYTSSRPAVTRAEPSPEPPDGSSETAASCTPQDALEAKLRKLMKPSQPTSKRHIGRRA